MFRQLLAFYLEAGVDCALAEEPVDRLASPTPRCPPPRSARRRHPARCGKSPAATPAVPRSEIAPAPEAAIAIAREAARTAPTLEALRALLENFEGCALKNTATRLVFADGNPASAHHVRRRSARARRGHRGPAVRRTFRQVARPDDRGDRARPQQGLHRQRDPLAAARQPHADAAGDADLPAVHPAADRARESRTCW